MNTRSRLMYSHVYELSVTHRHTHVHTERHTQTHTCTHTDTHVDIIFKFPFSLLVNIQNRQSKKEVNLKLNEMCSVWEDWSVAYDVKNQFLPCFFILFCRDNKSNKSLYHFKGEDR